MPLKIHGHPQKTEYLSPSEWPKFSMQGHWQPAIDPMVPTIGHLHLDQTAPVYAEISEPIVATFGITLFHVKGKAVLDPARQELINNIIWDATGSSTPPDMIGDPTGEKTWTGKMTIDLSLNSSHPAPLKGWVAPKFEALVFFDNGDSGVLISYLSYYSMLDPNAPETPSYPLVGAHFSPFSSRTNVKWGVNFVDTPNFLPIVPISSVWNAQFNTAGYGAVDLSSATYEQRVDLDLHHNVPGRLLDSFTTVGDISRVATYDPAVLGLGPHKMAHIRIQPDHDELAATLLVFQVPVGNVPPVETVAVPNVVGLPVDQAHIALTSIGLIELRTEVNSAEQIGIVVSQFPLAGTTVQLGTTISLAISKGNVVETWRPVSPVFEQLFNSSGQPTDRFRMTANGKTKEV